jgi:hypothetical protein
MSFRYFRAVTGFYKHNSVAALCVTILCCIIYLKTGDIIAQYLTKLATDALVLYFVFSLKPCALYYYYNLHISRTTLVLSFIVTDLLFFSFCLWVVHFI